MANRLLFISFVCIPIAEIAVFMQLGAVIGIFPTLAGILLTAFIGVYLLRVQGIKTLLSLQLKLREGQLPAREILTGFCIAIAGVLLITPGFVTDCLGFLLLTPPIRTILVARLIKTIVYKQHNRYADAGYTHQYYSSSTVQDGAGRVVDGEFTESNIVGKARPEMPLDDRK